MPYRSSPLRVIPRLGGFFKTEIETSANAAFAERVAAAAKAVVPKSNLRIAYPLFYVF
jgi:hypothetical protein